jgi:hypothetical protein
MRINSFNSEESTEQYLQCSTIAYSVLRIDPDPDPTFHSDANPDPIFQSDADPDPDPTTHFSPDLDPPML